MFRRTVLFLLTLSFVFPAFAQFEGEGVFALLGYSSQRLAFHSYSGETVDFGALPSTAVRLRSFDGKLCVLAGDDIASGEGSGLHIASFEEIKAAYDEERAINWEVIDLPDNTNPYDVVYAEGHLFISNQQSNEVVVLDPSNDYQQIASFSNLPNPQGLAFNGTYVAVANSGYGDGNTVTFLQASPVDSITTLEIWTNPQEIAVDDQGRFHITCSGKSWSDPPIPAKAAIVDFSMDEPLRPYLDLAGNPGEISFMTGPEDFGGKIVLGDEYATNDPHISAYTVPAYTMDTTVPEETGGGWALASGFGGIFIGSSTTNSLVFVGYDWSGYLVITTFDQPVADLLCYDAGTHSTVAENSARPLTPELSEAWPNPFNASTSLTLTLPATSHVRIELFNTLGRSAGVIQEGTLTAGAHRISLDASSLSSGRYFLRASSRTGSAIQAVTLVR